MVTEHSTSTEFHVAIQEFKYDGDLHFVVHLSRKPFPKTLHRWADTAISEVTVTKNEGQYPDIYKYMIKWQGGRRTPCVNWKRAVFGFHNITGRIRRHLGFEDKPIEWKEPKVKKK